ncbi:MAG: ABC transporter ATP-binding protein [Phycisphaeraceae bacterium]|nr:ABC transporter ATP-binding protein [Phycisphaerales bacterium]MCB9859790.1 ABC transporter ATP-binding protein [Phycisphaeraceae bacterium]
MSTNASNQHQSSENSQHSGKSSEPAQQVRARSSKQKYLRFRAERKASGHEPDTGPRHSDESRKRTRTRSIRVLLKAFWSLTSRMRGWIVLALATLTVSTSIALVLPASTKVVFDYIILDTPGVKGLPESLQQIDRVKLLLMVGLALVMLSATRAIVHMIGRWQMTRLTKRLQIDLRRKVFDHAVNLPLHRVQQIKSGGVASILREDAGGAAELLFQLVYNPWGAIIQLAGTLIVLAFVDWALLVGALVLIPIVWFSHKTWISRIRPVFREVRRSRTAIDAHATEAFGGMRIVRGFGRQRGESSRFIRGNLYMIRLELLAWWWSRGIEIAWQLMIPIASTGALVYGGWRVMRGDLTVGDVMMFLAFLMNLLGPLELLAVSAANLQTQLAGLDRILDLLDEPVEFAGARGTTPVDLSSVRGRITFENVFFSYPKTDEQLAKEQRQRDQNSPPDPSRVVLDHVSLDVPAGSTVALVGHSGAGKTTFCNLVARFYDPTAGRILLDGVDLRELQLTSFRALIGIVEQDVFLFDGTVRENIAYAFPDAPTDDVERAARAANAHAFITELEDGYDTLIGERGVRLSGGQKQRIAIARALLANPKILILDEATSNLDTESERLIQRSLDTLMKNRTSFVIAHRLSTITNADLIVVIEHGSIIETGTHDELMQRNARYAELVRMQTDSAYGNTSEPAISL